jgi:predicted PurR-regulated permease PerM
MDRSLELRLQWLLLLVGFGALLYLLGPVLTPFVVSALLAWLFDPLATRMQRRGLSRTLATCVVFVLLILVLTIVVLIAIPLLEHQLAYLVDQLPRYREWFVGSALPWVEARTGLELAGYLDPDRLVELLREHWQEAGGLASTAMGYVTRSGMAIIGWLITLMLIPVVTFYFLRDWPVFMERIHRMLPRPVEPRVVALAKESDVMLGGFLRGQMLVMLGQGLLYSVGLWLVGIDLAFLIGMGAGLISFIPFLGAIVGVGVAVIAALVQHGDLLHVVLVLAVFAFGQTVESVALTPWLVGDRIGMHPIAVIFAVMAGGQLFGFVGVLMALPVAAVVMVLLRYAHTRYVESQLYAGQPNEGVVMPDPGTGDSAREWGAVTPPGTGRTNEPLDPARK